MDTCTRRRPENTEVKTHTQTENAEAQTHTQTEKHLSRRSGLAGQHDDHDSRILCPLPHHATILTVQGAKILKGQSARYLKLLLPQMPLYFILALYMCFNWKYVELNRWCEGHWGYTTCIVEHAVQKGVGPYTIQLVTMGFDLQRGSLAARPAQLFQLHKKCP
eukprot:1137586-Pelagomonas_calceolata.AAC.2